MKKELQKAKTLLEKGQIEEALDLLKSISTQIKCTFSKCPGCGINAPMMQKEKTLHGECVKCGAIWGGKSVELLVKIGDIMKDETKKITKKEVEAKLWELYRQADPDADAFSINQFASTGWLKKTLAIKLGLPLPEEKLEKSEDIEKKSKGDKFVSQEIRHLIRDKGYEHKRAVAAALSVARDKGFKKVDDKQEMIDEHERLVDVLESPSHEDDKKEAKTQRKELEELKAEVKKSSYDMTKDEVIDTMLQMFKVGEEPALINRHSIAKYETVGDISEEVLKLVFRKAKRDYHALYKCVEAEIKEELNKTSMSGDPSQMAMSSEKLCKKCKKSLCKEDKDSLCKECGVKKTDQKSPRGRDVVPEGELKEKMKEADDHTGPVKPLIVK